MLLTQPMSWQCPHCQEKFTGIEGLKYSHRTGEQKTVWKKVRLGGKLVQVPSSGTFACTTCGKPVQV